MQLFRLANGIAKNDVFGDNSRVDWYGKVLVGNAFVRYALAHFFTEVT